MAEDEESFVTSEGDFVLAVEAAAVVDPAVEPARAGDGWTEDESTTAVPSSAP